ncbi:MAG: hypothetical protein ACI9U2_000439 [Bradymonadia bacterium]
MRRSLFGNLKALAGLLSLCIASPVSAQTCPESLQECNNRCIAMSERCVVAQSSNRFLLLGVLVGVGALVGLGFYLNPEDEPKAAPKAAGKAKATVSPIDLSVHENGGGLLWRGTF